MNLSLHNSTFLTVLLVVAAILAVVLIAVAIFLLMRSRKKNEDAPSENSENWKERWFSGSTPGMKSSFREAMRRLREKSPGWSYRYSVPWYVLVGESGSGKTTVADALTGMSAEIVEDDSKEFAPRWLLLDQAVLIDLPGRSFLAAEEKSVEKEPLPSSLSASQNHAAESREAWRSFLRLTTRYRPRQPLNGIVLTISAKELMEAIADPDHQRRLARFAELAQRFDDVQQFTSLSLPVYVLVTHCDAVPGFVSYSRSIFEETLAQTQEPNVVTEAEIGDDLFGWSNPHALDSSFTSGWVDEAFDTTNEVLLRHQLEMLAGCKTATAADGVFSFPFELQQLQEPLKVLLSQLFRTKAYHSSHLLRGIYFCGRNTVSDAELINQDNSQPESLVLSRGFLEKPGAHAIFVRDLFEFKIFAERYLATAQLQNFFSNNRSVLVAQVTACLLVLLLSIGLFNGVHRISKMEENSINPALQSLTSSLDSLAVSSGTNVMPAIELFSTLNAVHGREYFSLWMPYSYLDLGGLHRDLHDTLVRSFGVIVLRSCNNALEKNISNILQGGTTVIPPAKGEVSSFPPGTAWTADPAYRELYRYLTDLKELQTNIDRYRIVNNLGSGSFKQLDELLHYLGGRNLPDSSQYAHDPRFQKIVSDASYEPLRVPSDFDKQTGNVTNQLIDNFYRSWFDSNPLTHEVQELVGKDGILALTEPGATPSNEQIRAIVSRAQAMDTQLNSGSYDWVGESFKRENYPALGPVLNEMPFSDSLYTDRINTLGAQKLAGLNAALQTNPPVLDIADGKVRLNAHVRTLASVLNALLGYELMNDDSGITLASGPCGLIPKGTIWNSADLDNGLRLDAMRSKIEAELLPELPGEYRSVVQGIIDRRTISALSAVLQRATSPNPAQGDSQAAFEKELQNLSQSVDRLRQISGRLTALHATREEACLNKSLTQQANTLLSNINQQARGFYSRGTPTYGNSSAQPVSLWLYGVASADDLQSYLASEQQKIVGLSTDAVPLVQLLRAEGGHSDVLAKWHVIVQDVDALQAKKPGNPIQTLENFISADLDKISPEDECKAPALRHTSDVFLNVRWELTEVAVDHCHQMAIARFNEIAADFNHRLAGHFPFSQQPDARFGTEADPNEIAAFYQIVDRNGAGLANVLASVAVRPNEATSFLQAITAARPLVTGNAKNPMPVLGLAARFRSNRNHEVFGNRIAAWTLQVGQATLDSQQNAAEAPPLVWQLGDPVTLTVRYANNAPELPAGTLPSPAAQVRDGAVTYLYANAWSLFAFLRDHPPGQTDPSNQYMLRIPNRLVPASGSSAPPPDTVAYIQVDLLPAGAKAGSAALPVPVFPFKAPPAALKPAHGD